MGKKLIIRNLYWSATDVTLEQLFARYGYVESARVVTDRETGRSRGYGIVEMGDSSEAEKAIKNLNGTQLEGRTITVQEAPPDAIPPTSSSRYSR